MSKTPRNRKYVELEKVRVYLNKKTGNIQIITADPDLVGEPFQITLAQGTPTEKTLRDLLVSKKVIPPTSLSPLSDLPRLVPYPNGNVSPSPLWNLIPLGVSEGGVPVEVDMLKAPHTIISGPPGGGKTVIQRNFLRHALTHNDDWKIIAVDLRVADLSWLAQYEESLFGMATSLEGTLEVLQHAVDLMKKRIHLMEEQGTTNFRELKDDSFALMVAIDELDWILNYKPGSRSHQEAENNALAQNKLRDEINHLLQLITEIGATAGVHLLMSAQRYDEAELNVKLVTYNTTRILMGRWTVSAFEQYFGEPGIISPLPTGRGYTKSVGLMVDGVRQPNSGAYLQAYFSNPEPRRNNNSLVD